jgi:hypothetical protein
MIERCRILLTIFTMMYSLYCFHNSEATVCVGNSWPWIMELNFSCSCVSWQLFCMHIQVFKQTHPSLLPFFEMLWLTLPVTILDEWQVFCIRLVRGKIVLSSTSHGKELLNRSCQSEDILTKGDGHKKNSYFRICTMSCHASEDLVKNLRRPVCDLPMSLV